VPRLSEPSAPACCRRRRRACRRGAAPKPLEHVTRPSSSAVRQEEVDGKGFGKLLREAQPVAACSAEMRRVGSSCFILSAVSLRTRFSYSGRDNA
jgi:hypothetical protein